MLVGKFTIHLPTQWTDKLKCQVVKQATNGGGTSGSAAANASISALENLMYRAMQIESQSIDTTRPSDVMLTVSFLSHCISLARCPLVANCPELGLVCRERKPVARNN